MMALKRPEVQKKVKSYNEYFDSGILDEQFNQLLNLKSDLDDDGEK